MLFKVDLMVGFIEILLKSIINNIKFDLTVGIKKLFLTITI